MFSKASRNAMAASAALTAILSSQAALARTHSADPEVVQTAISAGAVDLNTPKGAQALLHRIRMRANDVCGANQLPESVQVMSRDTAEISACVRDFVDTAVAAFHSPALTALSSGVSRTRVTVASTRH